MTGLKGRKAQLFQQAVRQVRRRQESETRPAAQDQARDNDVEEMQRRIERAFKAADAA